jgi:hypothetical protein
MDSEEEVALIGIDTDIETYDFDFGMNEDEINMMAFGEQENDENEMEKSSDDETNSVKRQNDKVVDSKSETKNKKTKVVKWGYVPGWKWCGNHKGMKGHHNDRKCLSISKKETDKSMARMPGNNDDDDDKTIKQGNPEQF